MKILFLGDIVGKPGRKVVSKMLPEIIDQKKPDFVFANAENLAGGSGITTKTLREMQSVGIDYFTGGNHIFSNPDGFLALSQKKTPVIVPLNYPSEAPGNRWHILTAKNGKRLLLVSLLGQTFMKQYVENPFRSISKFLDNISHDSFDFSLIDFHAEATSEKYALKAFLDGKVSSILGTHTHVPTADSDITFSGMAFQADVGMNGSFDSCIGTENDIILKKLITQLPVKHVLEKKGRMQFNAVFLEFFASGKAKKIQHIRKII